MNTLRFLYLTGEYVSFQISAAAYQDCLVSLGAQPVGDPLSADVIIVHDAIFNLYRYRKILKMSSAARAVGYLVWEADKLPEWIVPSLAMFDEIWTPSSYSRDAIAQYFDPVFIIPHICERSEPNDECLVQVQRILNHRSGVTYFYSILNNNDPRKNMDALIRAYERLDYDGTFELILKTKTNPFRQINSTTGIRVMSGNLKSGHIDALHNLCDCFVSTHCSEGWGLGLSQAMTEGNLAMATGYSGNMEFMDAENSILLPYELDKIRHTGRNENSSGLWNSSMRWAYVDEDFLVAKMDDICRNPAKYAYKRKNAAETMGKYSKKNVEQLIAERL